MDEKRATIRPPLRAWYSNARRCRAAKRRTAGTFPSLSRLRRGRDENFTCITDSRMMATICKRHGVSLSVTLTREGTNP